LSSQSRAAIEGSPLKKTEQLGRETSMTYIIIVNWNGWKDTLECLESVFRLQGSAFRVIVCDNGSKDDSLEKIEKWANGKQTAHPAEPQMALFTAPPTPKPILCKRLKQEQVEKNQVQSNVPLTLIDCEDNFGFAAGNNVGIRYALQQPDMEWVWLLNNDTVVHAEALSKLLDKMAATPGAGIAGSTLIYYHQPKKVQAFGGARYFPCFGLAMHIGRFRNRRRRVDEKSIERQMRYVIGASFFVSRTFIEKVGLMAEDYFLYYEDLDWALRGSEHFTLAYAQDSLIFHKAGASIGSSNKPVERSLLSDYYLMRNRLRITRKFFPKCILPVHALLCVESLLRFFQGRWKHGTMIGRIAFGIQEFPPPTRHA